MLETFEETLSVEARHTSPPTDIDCASKVEDRLTEFSLQLTSGAANDGVDGVVGVGVDTLCPLRRYGRLLSACSAVWNSIAELMKLDPKFEDTSLSVLPRTIFHGAERSAHRTYLVHFVERKYSVGDIGSFTDDRGLIGITTRVIDEVFQNFRNGTRLSVEDEARI